MPRLGAGRDDRHPTGAVPLSGHRSWSTHSTPIRQDLRSRRLPFLRVFQHAPDGVDVQDLRPLRGRPSGPIPDTDAYPDAPTDRRRRSKTLRTRLTDPAPFRDDQHEGCSARRGRVRLFRTGPRQSGADGFTDHWHVWSPICDAISPVWLGVGALPLCPGPLCWSRCRERGAALRQREAPPKVPCGRRRDVDAQRAEGMIDRELSRSVPGRRDPFRRWPEQGLAEWPTDRAAGSPVEGEARAVGHGDHHVVVKALRAPPEPCPQMLGAPGKWGHG